MRGSRASENVLVTAALIIILGAVAPLFSQTDELDILAENVQYGTAEVKRNALQSLARMRSPEASRVAVLGLSDQSEVVVATAIGAVVYLPKSEAASYVSPFLNATSEFVRKEAAFALGKIGEPSSAPPLINVLVQDRKTGVRGAAAVALGKIGNPVAIEPLVRVLREKPKDSRAFLRRSAARAIGQIAERLYQRPVSLTTPDSFLPNDLKKSLEPAEAKTVDIDFGASILVLEGVILSSKENNDTKREAAFALGAIGDDRATGILRRLASSEDYYLAEICQEALLRISGR